MSTFAKQRVLLFHRRLSSGKNNIRVDVVCRIPAAVLEVYDFELLIIDDSSKDETFELSHELSQRADIPFKIHVLFNPANQGYGGTRNSATSTQSITGTNSSRCFMATVNMRPNVFPIC